MLAPSVSYFVHEFLVSAVKTSFLNLIYHGADTVVHLLLLKFSMAKTFTLPMT